MSAEIIAVGTELTSGAKLDTNSQWLSLELAEAGIPVRAHSTIWDNLDEMAQCIRLDMDCAAICRMAASFMARGSDFAKQVCAICAEICEACGKECSKHQHPHCQECAKACLRCAEECRQMAGAR